MLPGRSFAPSELVRILANRGWLIVLPFALGLSAAPMLAQHVAKQYRSETLIMVVPQRVPDAYVKSTVTAKMEDRLPSISSLILSRSRLERTIMDFNLYPSVRAQRKPRGPPCRSKSAWPRFAHFENGSPPSTRRWPAR